MTLEDHAEELASSLGVDKAEVEADLQKLVSYSVPMDEAKQSLRRKYGDSGGGGDAPTETAISDIGTDDGSVTITGRVLTVGKRSIQYQGDEQTITEGEIADESGRIDYTAWAEFDLSVGDTITVENAGIREWEGEPELNLNESTAVTRLSEQLDVPYQIGGERTLSALSPGDRGRTVEVQVLECERKTIDGRSGETEIKSGVVGDETARLPFTDWDPREEITVGQSVRIEDVHVREFRGVPSINVSEFSTVTPIDTVRVSDTAQRLSVREAVDAGGVFDVELVGTVIDVRDGSGLIERCPECGRVVQNGQCRSHGAVDAEDDLRVKAILDDGTDTVTVILDRELTTAVYGGGLADALEDARDAMDREVVAESIAEKIVGREFRVRGSLSVDEYGANLDATEFGESADDPVDRAEKLLSEVRG
ncbi:MAG: Single-stranded DNA binding protein [Natronomonas sp.]